MLGQQSPAWEAFSSFHSSAAPGHSPEVSQPAQPGVCPCGGDTGRAALVKVCVAFLQAFVLGFRRNCGEICREMQICMLHVSKSFRKLIPIGCGHCWV